MLAVARILRTGARLLLLDEISEGLAPVIVQKLAEMIRTLKAKGYTVVLVEQNFRFAAPLADRFYVMEHGRIVKQFAQARTRTTTWRCCRNSSASSHAQFIAFRQENPHETQDSRRSTGRRPRHRSARSPRAQTPARVKIGFITDMSSLYADIDGPAGGEMIKWADRRTSAARCSARRSRC